MFIPPCAEAIYLWEYYYTDVTIPYTLELVYDNGLIENYEGHYYGITVSKVNMSVSQHKIPECYDAMKASKESKEPKRGKEPKEPK